MASIQPQHTAGVVFTQPIFKTDPFTDFNSNWNVNLMSCFDDTHQCLYAYFCWCCFLGSLAGKIKESTCSCCCVPNALGVYRMKVRSILHIRGDSCDDYCVACCCPICAGLQIHNELKYRSLI